MNERVLQFRIGMFVIVAGLVLTMLIIWFGESPTLFRNVSYLTVHYLEAPGIDAGIPVRRSGIRIGEVASIKFDDRPQGGDGVLVTLAIEKKYRLNGGVIPRLTRALIGDVSIDMLPGPQTDPPTVSETLELSLEPLRILEGEVSPDPANALAAATQAFERAGTTLTAIELAANGVTKLSDQAESIGAFIETWKTTGTRLGDLAADLQETLDANAAEIKPALASLRDATERFNNTLDEPTQEAVRQAASNLSSSSGRLDQLLADLGPLVADLGADYGTQPKTSIGFAVGRVNQIAYQLGLLTGKLADSSGTKLNPNGTLQRLIMTTELHDSANRLTSTLQELLDSMRPMLRDFGTFADRIARDPSVISRGALRN